MLTKILFTLAVIIVVYLVYRTKSAPPSKKRTKAQLAEAARQRRVVQIVAYAFIGIFAVVGGVIFLLNWWEDHRVIDIRVVNANSGQTVTYQAYKKAIEGRRFTTVDGREVTLGDNDRVEMVEIE